MKNSIQHIQAFLAVARSGNFSKAAAELHLSPSALTAVSYTHLTLPTKA